MCGFGCRLTAEEVSHESKTGQVPTRESGSCDQASNPPQVFHCEEKIRIVLEGLRDEISIAELCRKEDIKQFWNRIPEYERQRVRDLALQ